jgi:ABC-type multidrug transport system ATPase subunit
LKTYVGDENVRGVSGGERKRVSIAEAMITKASTQMWDNSTRGLDASTALEYVNSIRSLTNMAQISTTVALYQAGESLYKAFDKVVVIEEGRCCYYGSSDDAAAYFESLGFERPPRWTTADFLTSVTDEHERRVKPGWENRIPRSALQFEDAFQKSEIAERNRRDIIDFENHLEEQRREREAAMTKATKQKNYTLSFHKQVMACTQRQFLLIYGDKPSLIGKWGGIFIQALLVGSLFYKMPKTSQGVFPRGGVLVSSRIPNQLVQ